MSLPTHEGAASARRPRWLRAPELLFIVSLLELFVGGGGRLTELGSVPLRMVLFAVCLLTTVALMASRPERVKGVALPYLLVACYLLVHLPAALHGLLLGNDESIILAELQQSIYWLAAPFFAMILSSRQMVFRTALLAQSLVEPHD